MGNNDIFFNLIDEALSKIPNYIDNSQGSNAWHLERLGRFTGSEIHKLVFGRLSYKSKSAYLTSLNKVLNSDFPQTADSYIKEVANNKLCNYWDELDTFAFRWGKKYEPEARQYLEIELGFEINETTFLPYKKFGGCSTDGEFDNAIIEIKCPYKPSNHLKLCTVKNQSDLKKISKEYYWQVQNNLMVTSAKYCIFASYNPRQLKGKRLHYIKVYPNKWDFKLLRGLLKKAGNKKIEYQNLMTNE